MRCRIAGHCLDQGGEKGTAILEPGRHDMNDALVPLDAAADQDQPGGHDDGTITLERFRPDHRVGDAGFVLDRHEHDALGRARPLADENDARDRDEGAVAQLRKVGAGVHAFGRETRTQELHRVGLQREPQGLIVADDMLGERHRWQLHGGLGAGVARLAPGKERQWRGVRQRLHLPEGLAPVEPHGAESVGGGEPLERVEPDAGAGVRCSKGGKGGTREQGPGIRGSEGGFRFQVAGFRGR